MKLLNIFFILLFTNLAFSQTINLDHFDKRIFTSEFNSAKDAKLWPSVNSSEEINLINNEEYTVELKSYPKDRFIFPDWHNTYPDYELNVSVSLQYLQDKNQVIGICFGYSKGHEQGYILELNNKKQFRIRNVRANGKITYVTGTNNKNSWQKFNMLYPKDNSNEINVLVLGNTVDIYLNNFFAFSFEQNNPYNFRDFGLMVGKSSKAVFKHVYLLINHKDYGKYDGIIDEVSFAENKEDIQKETKPEIIEINPENNNPEKVAEVKDTASTTIPKIEVKPEIVIPADPDVKKCLDMILDLRKELAQAEKEKNDLKLMLDACKDDNARMIEFITMNIDNELQKKAAKLASENLLLKDQIQKLKTENATLQDFKKFYQTQNKDQDIVTFLYDELKKIEEKNAFLARQVEILQTQVNDLKKK